MDVDVDVDVDDTTYATQFIRWMANVRNEHSIRMSVFNPMRDGEGEE